MKRAHLWVMAAMICGAVAFGKSESGSGREKQSSSSKQRRAVETKPKDDHARQEKTAPKDEAAAETEKSKNQVPAEFLPKYFGAKPSSFLVDPQGVLRPAEYRSQLGFLKYHAGDSSIDLYVMLFKGEQEIPEDAGQEQLIDKHFKDGRQAVVLDYFMGAPERAVIRLSPELRERVPVTDQKRAVESSAMQALKETDPNRQFEAFLVQMSIRIYWMEKPSEQEVVPAADARPVVAKAPPKDSKQAVILEKARAILTAGGAYAMHVAGGISFVLLLVMIGWVRRRSRCRFPEIEVEPRLGGAHAAGVGAVISFASAAVPPASQRNQMPGF